MGRPKKYLTEEERLEARRRNAEKWYQDNRERELERMKEYYEVHKEEKAEYMKQWIAKNHDYMKEYNNTPMGRAVHLVGGYKQSDKLRNRGECTLTPQWIIDNIFASKCRYCQKDDWTELGCDRIDNDLPHTPDNVVPCCEECNKKRHTMDYKEFLMLSSCLK